MFENYPEIVTVEELQEMLRIGRSVAYKILKSGELRSLRLGAKYLIPRAWVVDYVLGKQAAD